MFNLADAGTTTATTGSSTYFIIYLVVIVAIFYFLLIRPQSKRTKQRNAMLSELKIDDKVVTIGGIHGTIAEINDTTITLRVGDNQKLTFERSSINSVVND